MRERTFWEINKSFEKLKNKGKAEILSLPEKSFKI